MKKYTLDKTQTWQRGGHTLYKIQYTEEFKRHINEMQGVDIDGGWLESEDNLSQDGDCYVADQAAVYDGARVLGNATVRKCTTIRGPESIFDEFDYDEDEYIVDFLPRFEFDDDTDQIFTPSDDYDEEELAYFHRNDMSEAEREEMRQREAKFRAEFDWDSIHAETYGYSSDEMADEDFVD